MTSKKSITNKKINMFNDFLKCIFNIDRKNNAVESFPIIYKKYGRKILMVGSLLCLSEIKKDDMYYVLSKKRVNIKLKNECFRFNDKEHIINKLDDVIEKEFSWDAKPFIIRTNFSDGMQLYLNYKTADTNREKITNLFLKINDGKIRINKRDSVRRVMLEADFTFFKIGLVINI